MQKASTENFLLLLPAHLWQIIFHVCSYYRRAMLKCGFPFLIVRRGDAGWKVVFNMQGIPDSFMQLLSIFCDNSHSYFSFHVGFLVLFTEHKFPFLINHEWCSVLNSSKEAIVKNWFSLPSLAFFVADFSFFRNIYEFFIY